MVEGKNVGEGSEVDGCAYERSTDALRGEAALLTTEAAAVWAARCMVRDFEAERASEPMAEGDGAISWCRSVSAAICAPRVHKVSPAVSVGSPGLRTPKRYEFVSYRMSSEEEKTERSQLPVEPHLSSCHLSGSAQKEK